MSIVCVQMMSMNVIFITETTWRETMHFHVDSGRFVFGEIFFGDEHRYIYIKHNKFLETFAILVWKSWQNSWKTKSTSKWRLCARQYYENFYKLVIFDMKIFTELLSFNTSEFRFWWLLISCKIHYSLYLRL